MQCTQINRSLDKACIHVLDDTDNNKVLILIAVFKETMHHASSV